MRTGNGLRLLEALGNRGFSGAANAARGEVGGDCGQAVSPLTPALILMGDWCAVTQPDFENQSVPVNVDFEMQFDKKMRGERSIFLALLTEVG